MLNSLMLFVGITLMYSTPLVFAALGGVVSERSGVTNIGIEGMMTIGAVTGATVGYYSGSAWVGFFLQPVWQEALLPFSMPSRRSHARRTRRYPVLPSI